MLLIVNREGGPLTKLKGSLQIFGTMRHTDIIFSKLAFSILKDTWINYYYVYQHVPVDGQA